MMQRTLRFYVSSTFRDLEDERTLVAEYLVKNEQLPIQTILASADPVVEQCLADVESCHVMILLVASSYGTIVSYNGTSLSVTHHEFLHARSRGIPVLAFDLAYLNSPDPLAPDQRDGLRGLKAQIAELERIPASVPRKEKLLGEVLSAVQKEIRKHQAAPLFAASAQGFCADPIPSRAAREAPLAAEGGASTEMYLQVQLKPRVDRFDLIPEVFLPAPGGGGWQLCSEADPQPCEGVPKQELVEIIGDLCEQAQEALQVLQAQEALPWLRRDGIDLVVIELLLPAEVLVPLLVEEADKSPMTVDLRDVLRALSRLNYPYLIRSLDRAEKCKQAPVQVANRLKTHWQHASGQQPQLLACSRWPASSASQNHPESLLPFRNALQSPAGAPTALVGLPSCPADRRYAGELLLAILSSPFPVVLLWQADAADLVSRWARASELLGRALPDLPAKALMPEAEDGHRLHAFDLPPQPWCSRAMAQRRQRLLGAERHWIDQAVLLIDCPERWPKRITPASPRASGRYQLRRATPT